MTRRLRDVIDTLVDRNIRLLLLQQNVSQTELGNRIGVTFQRVQKYENGTSPRRLLPTVQDRERLVELSYTDGCGQFSQRRQRHLALTGC